MTGGRASTCPTCQGAYVSSWGNVLLSHCCLTFFRQQLDMSTRAQGCELKSAQCDPSCRAGMRDCDYRDPLRPPSTLPKPQGSSALCRSHPESDHRATRIGGPDDPRAKGRLRSPVAHRRTTSALAATFQTDCCELGDSHQRFRPSPQHPASALYLARCDLLVTKSVHLAPPPTLRLCLHCWAVVDLLGRSGFLRCGFARPGTTVSHHPESRTSSKSMYYVCSPATTKPR